MKAAAACYFLVLGWYIRWTGLDVQLAQLLRDTWDLAVLHSAKTVRDLQLDKEGS
jgi:hypothetical protein